MNITGTINVDGLTGIGAKIELGGTISLPDAGDLFQFGNYQANTMSGGQVTGARHAHGRRRKPRRPWPNRRRRELHARGRSAGRKRRTLPCPAHLVAVDVIGTGNPRARWTCRTPGIRAPRRGWNSTGAALPGLGQRSTTMA